MKLFVSLLLIALAMRIQAMTLNPNEPLVISDAVLAEQDAKSTAASPIPYRRWKSREGFHYKRNNMAEKIFNGFEKILNPVLDRVLADHPQGKQLRELHDSNKVDISHYMLPMRDGVRLSTIVINPLPVNKKRGTIISRSPYGPTSDQMADIFLVLNGFAAVIQDQRGTFLSEGVFSMWHDDGNDGYDTLEWIAAQPWSNGKVFSTGVSADGCGSAAMILTQPPHMRGQLIMWASMDGHETAFVGGAFREGLVGGWMTMMASLTHGASLQKTLPDIIAHEELSDWWTPIQGPGHYHQANWPTVHIAAWWDIFQGHHIQMYNGISQHATGHDHYLFVGPLGHCILGNLDLELLGAETKGIGMAIGVASELFGELPLTPTSYRSRVKKINVFVQGSRMNGRRGMGKAGHYWSSFDSWPEPRLYRLLLGSNSELTLESPDTASSNLRGSKAHYKEGYAEYSYDPASPMVTHGGNNLILMMLGMGCGSEDQRNVEHRNDVVVFTTGEAMKEPIALMGQMKALLYVSTDRPDTDFYVSVNDVHPDGHSMQIRYGMRRMRWRDSTAFKSVRAETEPGQVYRVEIDLWFTSYVVAPGHKLRVMIGSSNTPYYAKNDNSGQDPLGFKFELPAINRVYWSQDYPSHIELPVVSLSDLPKNDQL